MSFFEKQERFGWNASVLGSSECDNSGRMGFLVLRSERNVFGRMFAIERNFGFIELFSAKGLKTMRKKLTLVSIVYRGITYCQFFELWADEKGKVHAPASIYSDMAKSFGIPDCAAIGRY